MALAILDLVDVGPRSARFRIETGTNPYWQLQIGRGVRRRGGIDWIEDLLGATRLNEIATPAGGGLFGAAREISVKTQGIGDGRLHAQLFSFKTPERASPAFSSVVAVPVVRGLRARARAPFSTSASVTAMEPIASSSQRSIPCRTYAETYARTASLDELLGAIVKVAGPIVSSLLGAGKDGKANPAPGAVSPGTNEVAAALAGLLQAILGQSGTLATQKSLGRETKVAHRSVNRFLDGGRGLSQPFIFGIDDAIIAAVLKPIIEVMPQVLNSANQKRIALKQADNKLVSDVLSEVNRRMLLEKLLEAQRAPAAGGSPDLAALVKLLADAAPAAGAVSVAPAPGTPAAPETSKAESIDSRGVTLLFEVGDALPWNGKSYPLFVRDRGLRLRLKVAVTGPAPKAPLPRAILNVVFKDLADGGELLRKETRLEGIVANATVEAALAAEEVARLPANRPLAALAELRWPSSTQGTTVKASGGVDLVLLNRSVVGEQGAAVSPERELFDMQRFRQFWTKVWESPSLAGNEDKSLWKLDVATKFSVLLAPDHASNGIMAPKLVAAPDDGESLTVRIAGRMKAGIELAIPELSKLAPLFGESPLEAERLEALQTAAFARRNAGEVVAPLKLEGRRGERGIFWVVPVFRLFEIVLRSPADVSETGQVLSTSEEKVRFPLPASVRVLGVKSTPDQAPPSEPADGTSETPPEGQYALEGFTVEVSDKYALTQPAAGEGGGRS